MKSLRGWTVLAASMLALGGCATGGSARLVSASPVRGASATSQASASGASGHGGFDERLGSAIAGAAARDDLHLNEASALSAHETRFAGPTPQVPIPRDGHPGVSSNW